MGNCLRLRRGTQSSSSMVWADYDEDDDWDSSLATKKGVVPAEKQGFLDHDQTKGAFSTRTSPTSLQYPSSPSNNIIHHKEIKIKITKKQLEKLLGEVGMHEMPVDQVLSMLINAKDDDDHDQQYYSTNFQHQRSWRPRLQSIPEVD